jgi:hypothetical protein
MEQDRISRRRALKRMGAATAVAWTAPVLSSIRTPAFAQTYACPDDDCAHIGPCALGGCPAGCTCLQEATDATKTLCHQGSPCVQLPACTTCADCPSGWICAFSCCPGGPFCHPPCGTIIAPEAAEDDGAWSAPR